MKTRLIFLTAAMLVAFGLQASSEKARRKKIRVPDTLNTLRPIAESAQKENHIVLVNVGDAIPQADWPLIGNFTASRIQINVWTNSIEKTMLPELMENRSTFLSTFGEKAKIAVFIENSDAPDMYLTAQGSWCRVNIKPLAKDSPDRQTMLDRYAKALLKGIAYAAGCGAGYDNMSVTGYKTLTLSGLDEAGITITPEAYFPMLESLRLIGGDAILSPVISE